MVQKVLGVLDQEGEEREKVARLRELANSMGAFPGDLLKLIGLLVGREADWIATNATATELVGSLETLSNFHQLWDMLLVGRKLGIVEFGDNNA